VDDEDTNVQENLRDEKRRQLLSSPDPTTTSSIQKCPEGYKVQIPRQSDRTKVDKGSNKNKKNSEEEEDGGFFFLHQSTYAASFPGSGDKLITKYLVEALTGLRVGDTSLSSSSSSSTTNNNNNVDGVTTDENDDCCENLNNKQGHVVAIRTSWPHTSSIGLPTWDEYIPRAFVILRNPLHTLPRYFNHLYEMRNHLPHGAATSTQYAADSHDTWCRWRDTQIKSQILLYRRFVSFWMERGFTTSTSTTRPKDETSRVYFSYEELVDPVTGVDETKRLAQFLEVGLKSNALEWAMSSIATETPSDKEGKDVIDRAVHEATMTMVNVEDIPCVWREVVWSSIIAESSSSSQQVSTKEGTKVNYDVSRPYTPENLADMSQMLLELMNRWNRHQRLLSILAVYHREVNKMYLELTGKLDEVLQEQDRPQVKQQPKPTVKKEVSSPTPPLSILPNIHIIHASHPNADNNMSSAIVLNWLMGLFQPLKDVAFMNLKNEKLTIQQSSMNVDITSNAVSTTNNVDLLTLYKLIRPRFDEVFFVISNSGSNPRTRISDDGICNYKNVLCIEDFELRYQDEDELHTMVHLLTTKFRKRFDFFFHEYSWLTEESESNAVVRIEEAARVAIAMKDDPPEKIDLKFGVRGGDGLIIENNQAPALIMPSNRRRLSIAPPDDDCKLTWPQPPKGPIQTSYAASYPGCGARMTWSLIEALTGLWTGDDWDNNKRGHRVVTVKTHYPHDAGQLVSWDNRIKRALVIIRNPINAIPSFFNHIYEIKNNLAIHSQRAPVNDWIEWRDRLALIQINRFAKFIDYWMERFEKNNHDRIIISYETLTDDSNGPEEAMRIANFLSQSEGVDPIDTSKVPCIWKAVVKYKEQVKNTEKRRRLDLHHDSQRSGPTERPYTPVLLDAMLNMLIDLIAKWGQRHERLRTVLEGYQKDVSTAYAKLNSKQPSNTGSDSPSEKTFHVYQVSLPSSGTTSGTTVLNNLLVGLLDSEAAYKSSSVVTKTHDTNLLELYKKEIGNYDEIFFVMATDSQISIGGRFTIDNELCTYDNVMCIEPKELIYNNIQELTNVVNIFSSKFSKRFDYFFGDGFVDENKRMEAVKRLESIDNAVAALERQSVVVESTSNNKASKVHGKSFHIFQVSRSESEDPTPANVATNWLIGLFEPEEDYSFMVFDRERTVRKHDMTVPLESTIVTKTHILDPLMLYKQFRSQFDEIFFVVSGSSLDMETDTCQFDNVLCLQNEDLLSAYPNDIEKGVRDMTDRFRIRFSSFFESDFFSPDKVINAVQRLEEMAIVTPSLANDSFSVTDPKYGVHGGLRADKVREKSQNAGVLYYCGGAHKFLNGASRKFHYSTFALFHAKSLFPEFNGADIISFDNKVETTATPLTEDSLTKATENDLLIYHSHQHCDVSVEAFPGYQLHFNAEYYDLHPNHSKNTGEFTLDYLPAGKKTFVLGPHQDSSHSIRVPYCAMRLWYLHMTGKYELNTILEPKNKPKNSRERFMIYSQSHYIEYRERAALAFSDIAPIHTAGKCEGNIDAGPVITTDDSTPQCVPFDDKKRPASIQPIADLGMDHQVNNIELFANYRYALVFENSSSPGYVSEKILHGK
jgi:hypothetical protein